MKAKLGIEPVRSDCQGRHTQTCYPHLLESEKTAEQIVQQLTERLRDGDVVVAKSNYVSKGANRKSQFDRMEFLDMPTLTIRRGTVGTVDYTNVHGEVQIQWDTGQVTTDIVDSQFYSDVELFRY